MLFGSSILPAQISVGDKYVQLGDVVRRARAMSGLTPQAWNDQPPIEREYALVRAVYAMRAEADKAKESEGGAS